MSAATTSSTEIETVHVRLVDEAVDVWRPVPAHRLSDSVYELARTDPSEDEAWAFAPCEAVVVERRVSSSGECVLVAVARASDLDERSAALLRKVDVLYIVPIGAVISVFVL